MMNTDVYGRQNFAIRVIQQVFTRVGQQVKKSVRHVVCVYLVSGEEKLLRTSQRIRSIVLQELVQCS